MGKGSSTREEQLFGKHERAFLYQGTPDYPNVVFTELSGENIDKSSPIRDDQGQMLLMSEILFLLLNWSTANSK